MEVTLLMSSGRFGRRGGEREGAGLMALFTSPGLKRRINVHEEKSKPI